MTNAVTSNNQSYDNLSDDGNHDNDTSGLSYN